MVNTKQDVVTKSETVIFGSYGRVVNHIFGHMHACGDKMGGYANGNTLVFGGYIDVVRKLARLGVIVFTEDSASENGLGFWRPSDVAKLAHASTD